VEYVLSFLGHIPRSGSAGLLSDFVFCFVLFCQRHGVWIQGLMVAL
jgi:hypothetical protein